MNLKDDKQQNIQRQLDFPLAPTGEAREASREEHESSGARSEPENPASTDRMMEAICEWENLKEAMWRVKANKGSAQGGFALLRNPCEFNGLVQHRGQGQKFPV
jgi:RNA-directed DNA polymerase